LSTSRRNADEQRECEVGEGATAQHEQRHEDHHGRQARVDRPWKCRHHGPSDDPVKGWVPHSRRAVYPGLSDTVEYHHRVVDRVADDGEQRGQKHSVQRPAEPGERPDDDRHIRRQGHNRPRAERPPKPHGQIEQLRDQRNSEGDQGAATQLGPEARPDQLVAQHLRSARHTCDRIIDGGYLCVGQLACPDRDAAGPGVLHDRAGETGIDDGLPGDLRVQPVQPRRTRLADRR
jgi:hypothetical protein